MTNRHDDMITALVRALFRDLCQKHPGVGAELERDLERLLKQISDRGVGVILTDLPKLGKHLDRCLDRNEYVPSHLPLGASVSKTVVIPKFLRGLYLLVFDPAGLLRGDADIEAIISLRQVLYLAKKCKLRCPDSKIAASFEAFLEVDCSLPEPSSLWQHAVSETAVFENAIRFSALLQKTEAGRSLLEDDPSLGTRLDRVFARITSALGNYDPSEWKFRHGPGAIAAVAGQVNKYHWYSWPEALEAQFPVADYGFYSFSSWAHSASIIPTGDEPSRLIAVPKTFDKPRLIAAEPSSHQWCQQNMLDYFYSRAQSTWLNRFVRFRDQTQNQELARRASATGELATLDLSEASDRVTCDVVEAAFRSNRRLLASLVACRTRTVRVPLPRFNCEVEHRLNKFSTMGSAVTFPVESLIFLGCALAILGEARPSEIEQSTGLVSVFGDDIIVPTTARDRLVQLLEALSFKINRDKSFSGRNFRESCGFDAYRGVNVTPTYLRELWTTDVKSVVSIIETTNNFYSKYWLNVSEVLRRTVSARYNVPDVHPDSTVIGFHSRCTPPAVPKFRWNSALQRVELQVGGFTAKGEQIRPNDDSGLLQFFTEQPDPATYWSAGYRLRPRLKIKPHWEPIHRLYASWVG